MLKKLKFFIFALICLNLTSCSFINSLTGQVSSSPALINYRLSGAFASPGLYHSNINLSLLEAISNAGGFDPSADESKIILIRKTIKGEIHYRLDYNLIKDDRELNPQLKDGDIIVVN